MCAVSGYISGGGGGSKGNWLQQIVRELAIAQQLYGSLRYTSVSLDLQVGVLHLQSFSEGAKSRKRDSHVSSAQASHARRACEARKFFSVSPHSPPFSVSPHSPSPFLDWLLTFRSFRSRSQKYECFAVYIFPYHF